MEIELSQNKGSRITPKADRRSIMHDVFPAYTTQTLELNLPKPRHLLEDQVPANPRTPTEWFSQHFPEQVKQFGCPFLEVRESRCDGFSTVTPLAPNIDFFAAMLGGDKKLMESVVYYEPEMQFYYFEPVLQLYKPTTQEKLQSYYRGFMIRCAQELNNDTSKLNLFVEFRSDKTAKAVVQRAKSILAADLSFFSATSPHQRIKGAELHERLMRVLCETMLERSEGACLTVTQAYHVFCRLSEQRQLGELKRSMFKEVMKDLVRDVHGLALRRDVLDSFNKQQEAWRGLKLVEPEELAG